jgi:hypothetical protein
MNYTIPEVTAKKLKAVVARRKRSAFVAAAIQEKLKRLEQERLVQTLIEGYVARQEEDAEINGEWERTTLEGWK